VVDDAILSWNGLSISFGTRVIMALYTVIDTTNRRIGFSNKFTGTYFVVVDEI